MNLNRLFSLVEGAPPSTIGFHYIAPMIGAALVSGGASLLGGIGSLFSNKKSNKQNAIENQKDRDFQAQQAELAYLRQRGLIDEQNRYNSFANQRRLAEQAGLNPYRLFDGGSASGIAQSQGSTNAPQASGVTGRSFQPVLSAQDIQASSAAALNFAQAKLTNHQMGLTDANTRLVQMQGDIQSMQNEVFSEYGKWEARLRVQEADARVAFTDAETALTKINQRLSKYNLDEMLPEQVSNVIADTILKYSQSYLNDSVRFKTDQEKDQAAKSFNLQLALLASTISYNYAASYNQRQQGFQAGVMGNLYNGPGSPGYDLTLNNSRKVFNDNRMAVKIFNNTYQGVIKAINSSNAYNSYRHELRLPNGSLVKDYFVSPFYNAMDELPQLGIGIPSVSR